MESQKFEMEGLHEVKRCFQTSEELVHKQLSWWYYLHISLQVISVALGISAAIAIALQADGNVWITKPIGLISAILAGGIVTSYNVFHIRATIDELLDIQSEVLFHTNAIDTLIRRDEIEKVASDLLEIEDKYALILNQLGRRRRGLRGSVGTIWKNNATAGVGIALRTTSSRAIQSLPAQIPAPLSDDPVAAIRPQPVINRPL